MPRGSEQPAVLKYTVTQQFTQAVKRKETTAPSQAKPRSPVRSHPHILTFPLPEAASGPDREMLSRGAGLPFPGIFSSQLFPGSQCLLLQGRVDVPTAQHSPALEYRKLWQEAQKDVERATQRHAQPKARMAPHPRSSRTGPKPPQHPLPHHEPHSVPRDVPQGRNAGGTGKGLRLTIPYISQRTLILRCFSSSPAGKAAGSQLRRGGGTVKTPGSGRC